MNNTHTIKVRKVVETKRLPLPLAFLFSIASCTGDPSAIREEIIALKQITVVIDPGHGGKTNSGKSDKGIQSLSKFNNAWTATGLKQGCENAPPETWEKFLALELSKEIAKQINEKGSSMVPPINAVMTRETDINPDMKQRAQVAKRNRAASFVSIHFNAHEKGKTPIQQGAEAIIQSDRFGNANLAKDKEFGERLAAAAERGLKHFIPELKSRRPETKGLHDDSHLSPDKDANGKVVDYLGSNLFFQIAQHQELVDTPACFLEVAFIDNPIVDEKICKDGKWRTSLPVIAREISDELLRWHSQNKP